MLLAGLLVSACSSTPPPTANTKEVTPKPVATTQKARLQESTSTPEPEPKIIAPAMTDIIGWRREELSKSLGSASLVRRDLGSEIWQYRASDCVLLVFLYPKEKSDIPDDLLVTHIDVSGEKTPDACIYSVVKLRRSKTS